MGPEFCVGTAVRLPRPEAPRWRGTGTIATLQDDGTACVIWDPLAPQPLPPPPDDASSKPKRRLKRPFLLTPWIQPSDSDEIETMTSVSALTPLLDFELQEGSSSSSPDEWKERGDRLLRLGDASKACSYYEMALKLSSILQVGATVMVKSGGHAKLADVDCLDDDDDQGDAVDVTMQDSGEETVVKEAQVLLCLWHKDEEDHLQERILLNLARCLLQLADLARHGDMASERRPKYLRSAVLATTWVMTISDYYSGIGGLPTKLEQKALVLRGQAQAGLGRFANAIADTQRLLEIAPDYTEGTKQLKNLQGQQEKQKRADKKLVQSMCWWVQKATMDSKDPVSNDKGVRRRRTGGPQITTSGATTSLHGSTNTRTPPQGRTIVTTPMIVASLVLPLFIALIVRHILSS